MEKKVGSNQGLTRKESTIGLTIKKGDDLDFEVCKVQNSYVCIKTRH